MDRLPNGYKGETLPGKMEDNTVSRRFWVTPDGSHEHRLKDRKVNQNLKGMFRNLLDRKKGHDKAPLTEIADCLVEGSSEQTKLKGVSNQTMTLVQKYGKCQEIIGYGKFGIVRIAHKTDERDPSREKLFAVKVFRRRRGESAKKYQKRSTSEFCISSSMEHHNIIRTFDLIQDGKGDFCEVMEYCAGGDLYTFTLSAGRLEVLEADCFFKQLIRGVEYIHSIGVAHQDLKPENLLLTKYGALKIADFGNGECFRMPWEEEGRMTSGVCGSAPYIAPEEYIQREFEPRGVDLWACGIIYMAMRTGRHLWHVARKGRDEFYTRYLDDRKEQSGFQPIETLKKVLSNLISCLLNEAESPHSACVEMLSTASWIPVQADV